MTVESNSVCGPVAVHGSKPECLTEIFRDEVNLAVWRREPRTECLDFATNFASEVSSFERFIVQRKGEPIDEALPGWALDFSGAQAWLEDVRELISMYRCLFEPAAVGIRVHVLADTMCPRFHTDRVPARLLVTYAGRGTEWLAEPNVFRPESPGPLPEQSVAENHVQVMPTGSVAILKGEAWIGNEGRGLVHRSPAPGDTPRLVLGLDWLS
jgi:hypothetical protein